VQLCTKRKKFSFKVEQVVITAVPNFKANFCTHSMGSISFWRCGSRTELAYSRWGHTKSDRASGTIVYSIGTEAYQSIF